jgi:uncharacterized protein
MSAPDLGIMFTLGLISSLHCVQMCGPIVLAYSVALGKSASPRRNLASPRLSFLPHHLAYNVGRIVTYSALGAVAGLLGGTIGLVGRLAGVEEVVAIVAGSLMVLAGLAMLDMVPTPEWLSGKSMSVTSRFLRLVGSLLRSPAISRRFLMGLALGFLPCGLVYAALLKAMASGTALGGATSMLAFGLGTAGSLLAIGMFSSAIRGKVNQWVSQMPAVSVLVLGALLLWRGTGPQIWSVGAHAAHAHH